MWKRWLSWAFLIGLFVGVERVWGWSELLRPWLAFSPWAIVFGLVLLLASYVLRALRLYDYFRCDMRGGFGRGFRLMLLHNLFNNLLPMRAGEVSFPVLMSREFGIEAVRTVPALFWFRLLDLHTVITIGAVAVLGWVGVPAWMAWLLLPWLAVPLVAYRVQSSALDRLAHAHPGRWGQLLRRALTGLPANARGFWRSWGWTWANWLVKLAVLAWVLQQFLAMPVAAALFGAVVGDLTTVLPVNAPGGFGSYEAGVVAAISSLGVSAAAAVGAALNLHLFALGSAIVSGGIALLVPGRNRD